MPAPADGLEGPPLLRHLRALVLQRHCSLSVPTPSHVAGAHVSMSLKGWDRGLGIVHRDGTGSYWPVAASMSRGLSSHFRIRAPTESPAASDLDDNDDGNNTTAANDSSSNTNSNNSNY